MKTKEKFLENFPSSYVILTSLFLFSPTPLKSETLSNEIVSQRVPAAQVCTQFNDYARKKFQNYQDLCTFRSGKNLMSSPRTRVRNSDCIELAKSYQSAQKDAEALCAKAEKVMPTSKSTA